MLTLREIALIDADGDPVGDVEIRSSGLQLDHGFELRPAVVTTNPHSGRTSLHLHDQERVEVVGFATEEDRDGDLTILRIVERQGSDSIDENAPAISDRLEIEISGPTPLPRGLLAWAPAEPECFASSDEQGRLVFDIAVPDEIFLAAPGYDRQLLTPESTSRLSVSLSQTGGVVSGRVVDPDGRPLEDVEITLQDSPLRAYSNASGSFEIRGFPYSGRAHISLSRAGFVPAEGGIEIESETEETPLGEREFELARWTIVTGRIVDEYGRAAQGLSAVPADGAKSSTPTDSAGRFAVDAPPGENLLLFLDRSGDVLAMRKFEASPSGGNLDLGTFSLYDRAVVWGFVRDQYGAPVAEAAVHLDIGGRHPEPRWPVDGLGETLYPPLTTTDESGYFALEAVPIGSKITIGVAKDGLTPTAVEAKVQNPSTEVDLTIVRLREVPVLLLSATDLEPLAGLEIAVDPGIPSRFGRTGRYSRSYWTDRDGLARISVFPEGGAKLVVTPGFVLADMGLDVPRFNGTRYSISSEDLEQGEIVVLELQPESSVSGTIHLQDGSPAVGVRVLPHAETAGAWPATATTDNDGRFQLEGLAPGRHRYFLISGEYGRHHRVLEVRSGENAVEWSLEEPERFLLAGRVTPLPSRETVVLSALQETSGAEWQAVCDPSGSFNFGALPSGRYHIRTRRDSALAITAGHDILLDTDQTDWQILLAPIESRPPD